MRGGAQRTVPTRLRTRLGRDGSSLPAVGAHGVTRPTEMGSQQIRLSRGAVVW